MNGVVLDSHSSRIERDLFAIWPQGFESPSPRHYHLCSELILCMNPTSSARVLVLPIRRAHHGDGNDRQQHTEDHQRRRYLREERQSERSCCHRLPACREQRTRTGLPLRHGYRVEDVRQHRGEQRLDDQECDTSETFRTVLDDRIQITERQKDDRGEQYAVEQDGIRRITPDAALFDIIP